MYRNGHKTTLFDIYLKYQLSLSPAEQSLHAHKIGGSYSGKVLVLANTVVNEACY